MARLGTDSVMRAYVNGGFLMKLARQYGAARLHPYIDKVGTLVSTLSTAGTPIVDRMVMKLAGSAPAVRKVGGTSVHAMASSGIGLYYADVDGKFVVTDQPQGIRSLKGSGTSLSDSAEFQQ